MAQPRSPKTLTIPLSNSLREFLDAKLGLGKSSSDYVVRLLKKLQRAEMEELEAKLLASLDSGPSLPVDEKFWQSLTDATSRRPKRPGRS
jgi:Arc/MetJ-type ribon-helix-helix transcriptional regulator